MAITIKSSREINIMRRSGAILGEVHELLANAVRPGISTDDLDQLAHDLITERGAKPSFLGHEGFPKSICTSVDSEVVHGIPNQERLLPGQIVSVDVGVFLEGYHTDGAFTLPVGEIDDDVRALIRVTREALEVGCERAVAGNRVGDISAAIQSHAESHGYGIVRELTGHGVGRQLWEDPQIPNYGDAGTGPLLRPGMTIAIEPMLTLGDPETFVYPDGWTIATVDGSYAAHWEHTLLITKGDPEILTRSRVNVV
ncbi:MAG TPA: type I methionyl aminopeptidase [Nitrolancea sp.]|nr:type I methionyl aminopeptidase [Nitrolancea sp.]